MAQILFTDKLKGSVLTHQDVNEIKQTVNINGQNSVIDVQNVGDNPDGHGVFAEKPDGNTVNLKKIAPFTGITVGSTDKDVVISITDTGVTSGEYTFPKFTVNNQGQLTVAESNRQDILDLFSVEIANANADGHLSYTDGVLRFTPAATRTRVSVKAGSGLTYDVGTGVFGTFEIPNSQLKNSRITINNYSTNLGASVTLNTDDIAESVGSNGNSNATNQWFTPARARDSVSLQINAAASNGSLNYNKATGRFTYRAASDLWARSVLSTPASGEDGDGLSYNDQTGVFMLTGHTAQVPEDPDATVNSGTMYFTQARARASVSAGNGLQYTNGVFSVKSDDTVQYDTMTLSTKLNTNTIQANTGDDVTVDDNMIVTGNLTVQGVTETVLSETVKIQDNILELNSNLSNTSNPTQHAGIEVNRGKQGKVQFIWNETRDEWTTSGKYINGKLRGPLTGNVLGDVTGTVSDVSNHDTDAISEGSTNLYYTNARARKSISKAADASASGGGALAYDSDTGVLTFTPANVSGGAKGAISVTDSGGDGSLAYDGNTGVITYTGPSAAETRAHFAAGTGLSYTSSTGTFTLTGTTDQVPEATTNPTNLYFTASRAKTALGYTGTGLDTDISTINTSLDGKSATGHGHTVADVTGLQTALDGKSGTGHGHTVADVTGLQTALDAKLKDITGEQLSSIGDVMITTPLDGQTLVYDDGTGLWRNEYPVGGTALSACSACDLGDSADVDITNVQTGDTIQWNGTRWVNVDMISLTELKTVVSTSSNFADFQSKIAAL